MSTLIIVEHHQVMQPSTRQVLAAAMKLNQDPVLLVVGHECQAVAQQAAILEGVKRVLVYDNPCYADQLAENVSQLVASIAPSYTAIMAAASTYGKNILPRVAAYLDVAQISDVVRIIDENTFEHPIYAGNAIETVRCLDDKKVFTIRTTAFDAVTAQQMPAEIKKINEAYLSG